jgi:hypothetical protein
VWVTREETEVIELDLERYKALLMASHEGELEDRMYFLRHLVVPVFMDYNDGNL